MRDFTGSAGRAFHCTFATMVAQARVHVQEGTIFTIEPTIDSGGALQRADLGIWLAKHLKMSTSNQ